MRAAARVHSAWASAALAGSDVPLDSFEPPFPEGQGGRVAEAALQVASEVGALADTWRNAPLQALARLHAVASAGDPHAEPGGRPRDEPGVSERLATLAEVVSRSQVAGVIVSAVVHGELLTLRPFGSLDDVVARAASRVVLVQRGVDPDAIAVPEMGIVELGDGAYQRAAQGFAEGTSAGVAHWVTFHAAAVQRGATYSRTLC